MESNYFCAGEPNFLNLFDLSYLPQLLTYSFIPTSLVALFLSIFIFNKDKHSVRSVYLILFVISFIFWSLNETLQWVTVPANLNLFFWHLSALFEFLVLFFFLLFTLFFIKSSIHRYEYFFLYSLLFLLCILVPTTLNIKGFNLWLCEGVVNSLISYIHIFGLLSVLYLSAYLVLFLCLKIKRNNDAEKNILNQKIITLSASICFITIFTLSNSIGEAMKLYVLGLLAPIGIIIFEILLSYTIVKYKAFNIKLAGAQALVFALWFLVGSLLFVAKSPTTRVISGITLLITSVAGYLLVRSVKHEIQQREKIQELAENLAQANIRLKELDRMKSEFVSIASHQLRSPLTSIRGYASMLKEGTYGKMPQTAIPVLENIAESSHFMAQSVEDYLNVSRIEAGNMKYELSDFSIKEQAEKITDELRQVAIKKGLALLFRSDISGSGRIHADIGKVRQVLMNLIDNSMKYTPKGSIDVLVHDDPKKKRITVSIVDTGIGMDTHTVGEVFEKFVRAKNANCVNVTGTGLGLYVAKKMVDEMKGVIWAESDGPNKGSRFHLEFPEI